jgi:2-amino-4-hydroxy-6-hydroxymethyldihydropteridine diphosphokinase
MATCLIGLGSNVGDRRRTLDRALDLLDRLPAVQVIAQSPWHETAPVGGPPGQGRFLNGAALLETSLEPLALATLLWEIEAQMGRARRERWGPRTLDLDLLLYDRLIIETPPLRVPHPRMAWRRFVLEPTAEIAPSMVHPAIGWTMSRLLEHLNTALPYIAITGPAAIGKGKLARRLVHARNRRRLGTARLVADPCGPASYSGPRLALPPEGAAIGDDPAFRGSQSSPGPDWPSTTRHREIEFIERRAPLVALELPVWRWPDGLAISDFWLEQSLSYAETSLKSADSAVVADFLAQQAAHVVTPKLLVVLGRSADRLGLALANLARRPGRGPALVIKDPDLDRAAEEVLAAIDAMA